jgi:farnesyl diphosphate synthase
LELLPSHHVINNSNEAKVKQLYKELDLESVYRQYEEESFQQIQQMIAGLEGSTAVTLPSAVFNDFAGRIYKRNK